MPVLDTGRVAAEKARSFLDFPLAEIFGFAEFSEFFADEHGQKPTPTSSFFSIAPLTPFTVERDLKIPSTLVTFLVFFSISDPNCAFSKALVV